MKRLKKINFRNMKYSRCINFVLNYKVVVLLLVFIFPLSVLAQNQRVSINVANVDVQTVFGMIKQQSGLNFMYNTEQIKIINPVSLNVQNVTVDSALTRLLAGTPFKFAYEKNTIVISKKEEKEEPAVTVFQGVVEDDAGVPIAGVTVLLKGSAIGVTTDIHGKFKMVVPKREKSVLIFSFIGMKSVEHEVKDDKPLIIKMENEVTQLEEVAVFSTGYYDVDKRMSTSAVTSLKAEDVLVPGISNIDQMLEGHVPGMIYRMNSGQVGAAPKIKIRGTTTLLSSTAPLWVVDGVILNDPVNIDPSQINDLDFVNLLGNAISGLNPEDVERIDVLKDASATAIYGPQSSNGVIVITTKKGKVGKPSVSYSVSGTFRQRPRYTDRAVNVMNSRERIDYSKEVIEKGLKISSLNSWVGYEAAIYDLYNKDITQEEFQRRVTEMETCNTDWLDLLLKDSFSHSHTLSLSGGSEHMKYYTSVGFNDDYGNIINESSKRYSGRANIDINYNKFSMQFQINGNLQKRKYTPSEVGIMNYAYNTSRSVKAYNDDGTLWFYQRMSTNSKDIYDHSFSILNEQENSSNKIQTDQLGLNVAMSYRVLEPLKLQLQFSYNVAHTENEIFYDEKTWYAGELRKTELTTNEPSTYYSLMPKGGEIRLDNTKNNGYNLRAQLTFSKYMDEVHDHQITAVLIGEVSSKRYTGFKITRRGYMPERGLIIDKVVSSDKKNPYQAYNTWLQESEAALGKFKDQLTNLANLTGVLTYAYKSTYILNANIRIDASNAFGERSNYRLLPIWSVSGRWNMNENILRNSDWINTLGLRASFGYRGNMSNVGTPKLQLIKKGRDDFFKEYYSEVKTFPNPFLKWEKTSTLDIGLEFSLFNNKLNGSFSYYYSHTSDAFMDKTVSRINGVSTYQVNRGTLVNQGYDIALNFVPINTMLNSSIDGKRRGFVWRIDPNFGAVLNQLINKLKYKNKTLQDEITYQNYLDGNVYISGKPVNTFYSYRFKGLSPIDGRPMFYDTEETILVDGEEIDRKEILEQMSQEEAYMTVMEHSGCREPFLQGGISNYFGWRSWGLSFNLAYSIGAKVRLFKMYPDVSSGETIAPGPEKNLRREFVNRWRRPGDEMHTNVPGILDNSEFYKTLSPWWKEMDKNRFASNIWEMYDQSNLRVVSGNYLKLQSVSLRYVIPEVFCKKLSLKSAYLSFSGTNLFTVCSRKLKGQDPTQSGNSDLVLSVRPTYSFQLNVSF